VSREKILATYIDSSLEKRKINVAVAIANAMSS
jgi:hypothetical protein